MRAGFAGLGRMGALMAGNLVSAGHEVRVWNRSCEKARALAESTGCKIAASPAELTQSCEAVITMLADDASSREVYLGKDGLYAGRGASHFVEMGTMSPEHIAALAKAAPEGAAFIDAPVSGATEAARSRQLLVMAGCSEASANPIMPLFEAMAKQTIFLGKSGAGCVMKLAVNSLIHGINQTLAEAMTLAEVAQIAPETAFDVIEASAACAPMLKYRRPLYLDESAHDVTFTVALAKKDMMVTAALAEKLGTAMPQGLATLAQLSSAEASGFGQRDMASMLNFMRKENS